MEERTCAIVDLQAVRHNILEEKKKLTDHTKMMAVVKADAYGHGAVAVSKELYPIVDAYGVAVIEEALELRTHGIDKMILILGYTPPKQYQDVIANHISQTVYTFEMAKELDRVAAAMGEKAIVHIKVDTGMSRLGFFPTEESVAIVKEIAELTHLELEGIFTHFAKADKETIDEARVPFEKYIWFVKRLEEEGIHIPIRHVANSASIMQFPEAYLDMVRSGITTYGMYPSEEIKKEYLDLQPAMEWKTVVSFVKNVEPGTSIGYGGTFTAQYPMRIATIPVGYADGLKRDLSNKGQVLIHGERANIVGRICMDQFMVDVTNIPDVAIGDEVTIFGRDGDEQISVEEIADLSHSFNYEYVCGITNRVPRKYIHAQDKTIE